MKRFVILVCILANIFIGNTGVLISKQYFQLSIDSAVDIAINNSYKTKMLKMEIERSMFWLKASRASLKTQVYMDLKTPDLNRLSDYKWNSTLRRDEIVRENTQLWQSDLSVIQPVILFGYPTNGYLSLNYQLYKYLQKDNGSSEVDFYNRLYVKYEQPFFLPNELKNNLEVAELNLKAIKLAYISDRVEIIDDISKDFYELFELTYKNIIYENQLNYLKSIHEITKRIVQQDSSRRIENSRVELEITNIQENLLSNLSALRRNFADLKQRLRLNSEDSLFIIPVIKVNPIVVNLEQALEYGFNNNPKLQRMQINKRRSEIDVENEKGRNAFHISLEMTYGLEKKNHYFHTLWERFDNSNSITLNAYVPIWDGGERNARIQAELLDIKRRELQIEEEQEDIKKDILNTFTNLNEYYQRAINLKKSVELAKEITKTSLEQYQRNEISLQDLLQIVNRHKDTEDNFLEVYKEYRLSLLDLMIDTYYNFEKNISLLDEFDLKYYE